MRASGNCRLRHGGQVGLKEGRTNMPVAGTVTVIDTKLNEQVISRLHPGVRIEHGCPARVVRDRIDNALAVRAHCGGHVGVVKPGLNAPTADRTVDDGNMAVEHLRELTAPATSCLLYTS